MTCETNETGVEILQWNVNFPSGDTPPLRRSVPIEGNVPLLPFFYPTDYGDVVFNFSRTSNENAYPLKTKLLISEVNLGINGTEITCANVDLSDQRTTIIHVIDQGKLNS